MSQRAILYFALAAIPSLTSTEHCPATGWEWFRFALIATYQGLLAITTTTTTPAP